MAAPLALTPVIESLAVELETGEPVGIAPYDLTRHAYILGATGCGKTSLIVQLIEQDIRADHTICIVDLRGDLVAAILGLLSRLEIDPSRVILLDLREKERVQGFNPLAGAGEAYIRALHVLDVLEKEAESWGVQLQETLRNALLLLASAGASLADIERLLFDERFRDACLRKTSDESLIGFWNRFSALSFEKQQTWSTAVLNKVTPLLAVPQLRQILNSDSPMDLENALSTKGKIILVSLAVDELHRSSCMLGSLFVSSLSREMLGRVNISESSRNAVRLYVDEFENFGSESFEGLIAEGRRFGLTLCLSHQTLTQIHPRLRSVIRNNVALQVLFQCGFEDARHIKYELPEDGPVTDLRFLETGQAVLLKRDGSARAVQFRAPRKPASTAEIDAYRDRIVKRQSKSKSPSAGVPSPPRSEKPDFDVEDLL